MRTKELVDVQKRWAGTGRGHGPTDTWGHDVTKTRDHRTTERVGGAESFPSPVAYEGNTLLKRNK